MLPRPVFARWLRMLFGGAVYAAKRAALARQRFATGADLARFGAALIVIVLGGLMTAESVVSTVTGSALFFEGIGRPFEFVVGFITIVLGATLIPSVK